MSGPAVAVPRDAAPQALPTVVIGGYLGAGKTTLVNRLLREAAVRASAEGGRRIAVLVNDFGEVSIDADLIVGAEGGVLSLAGGCVCCSFGADLVGALEQVAVRVPQPEVVLIETSGVGLPAAVARTALLMPRVRVEQIVVVADAAAVRGQAAERYVGSTVRQQLHEADLVLLGKTDLVEPAQVGEAETWLLGEGVRAPCVAMPAPGGEDAALAALVLGPVSHERPMGATRDENAAHSTMSAPIAAKDTGTFAPRRWRPASSAAERFVTTTLRFNEPVDTAALGATLLAQGVLRAKGVLLDVSGQWQELQLAGGRVHRHAAAAPLRVQAADSVASAEISMRLESPERAASPESPAEAAGRLVTISLRHG